MFSWRLHCASPWGTYYSQVQGTGAQNCRHPTTEPAKLIGATIESMLYAEHALRSLGFAAEKAAETH